MAILICLHYDFDSHCILLSVALAPDLLIDDLHRVKEEFGAQFLLLKNICPNAPYNELKSFLIWSVLFCFYLVLRNGE